MTAAAPIRVDPDEVGLSADRLTRIGVALEAEIAADRLPGAVVGIVRGDRLAYLEAFGEQAPGRRMPTDALFWVASMTKPIVAAAVLGLVEQGDLVLDDAMGTYLPDFVTREVADGSRARPALRQPTVLDLMRHTAGIPEGLLGDTPLHARYADAVGAGMTPLTAAEFADRLAALPLLHDPGAMWHYGWGFDLLGFIVERLTAQPLREFLSRQLCRPLGMTDTAFGAPPADRFALPRPADAAEMPDLTRTGFDSGGAGLVSTAPDYLQFIRLLLRKGAVGETRLLGRKTVEFMTSDLLDPATDVSRLEKPTWNPGYGFGLGMAVRRRMAGESGLGSVGEVTWPGAAGTFWWADPAEDLGAVFLAHVPTPAQTRLHRMIKTLVLQALD